MTFLIPYNVRQLSSNPELLVERLLVLHIGLVRDVPQVWTDPRPLVASESFSRRLPMHIRDHELGRSPTWFH